MLIGYARTSTLDQAYGLDAQIQSLRAIGCARIFSEQVSSVAISSRQELAAAIEYIRADDVLVVTKLDRLARSVGHLLNLLEEIERRSASLRVIDLGIDTATPTGRLIMTVLAGIAAFEREIMLERQREGIERAKVAGRYKGRAPTARAKQADAFRLHATGMRPTDIARILGISRASVYRILTAEPSKAAPRGLAA